MRVDLARAERAVRTWLEKNRDLAVVDIRRAARELPDVSVPLLSTALTSLSRAGMLRRVYAVRTPEGMLLATTYPSVQAIPREVRDPLAKWFRVDDGEVVPAYERVG